jgi:NH3-dependent NAD+ synthetase
MKIRLGFVSNSSSSSFTGIGWKLTLNSGVQKSIIRALLDTATELNDSDIMAEIKELNYEDVDAYSIYELVNTYDLETVDCDDSDIYLYYEFDLNGEALQLAKQGLDTAFKNIEANPLLKNLQKRLRMPISWICAERNQ